MFDFDPNPTERLFWTALALIAAACLFAPIFRRLGLGTILGYLAAGFAIQLVFAGSFAEHPEELLHFAEFGVVLFMFVIGLELKPSSLWAMRNDIFGLGLAQMLACGAALAVPAVVVGLPVAAAVVIGFGLALSSTALVMRTLDEHGQRASHHGRKAFAILLFQDLAIVPLLLMVAFLAPTTETVDLMESLGGIAAAVVAIAILVLAGRYLLDPMFRLLAATGMPELMTASALGIVIAAAMLMNVVGMSYAMGAFLAGVMLAESTYRHEVEANIEPFRGLFLGLFFVAVGLSLDGQVVAESWVVILVATLVAMTLKGGVIFGLAAAAGTGRDTAVRLGLGLSQHGEFGFVIFTAALAAGLLDPALSSVLIAVVTLSMALAPLVARLEPMLVRRPIGETMDETYDGAGGSALVIGFGRFGQIACQPLFARGVRVTILDSDANRVREAERFGFRVYFGDGSRRDVLRAAGAGEARLVAVCIDDAPTATEIVALVKAEFPRAQVMARTYDRRHAIELRQIGVDWEIRETVESALAMGGQVLEALGETAEEAAHTVAGVRARDLERLHQQEEGDLYSGLDRLHVGPVRPEPLEVVETQEPEPEAEAEAEAARRS